MPLSEDIQISSFAWLADAQCMEYTEAGEIIESYSNHVSSNSSFSFQKKVRFQLGDCCLYNAEFYCGGGPGRV